MRVFVTGATGVLGRRVVPALIADGHEVVAVARDSAKAQELEAAGAQPAVLSDIFDVEQVRQAAGGCGAYLNLATCIPPLEVAWKASAWRDNDRIRTEGSAVAAQVAKDLGMEVLVQESIVMNYPDCGDEWITEEQTIKTTLRTASAATAEETALRAQSQDLRTVVLRFGLFGSADGSHAISTMKNAAKGFAMLSGRQDGFISGVRVEDAAAAVVAALAVPSGIYNVTGNDPLRRSEIAAQLAQAVGRKKLRVVPGRAALLLGDKRVGAIARSQRVSNAKFKAASGWSPSDSK
ncbi:MAG: NAD(P)-dependent oxidoreductase [Thermoleophilaceae bacterium]|nr:NAD(P)-dependent oxidoreductase [Thermoleophilaceae bacterium]